MIGAGKSAAPTMTKPASTSITTQVGGLNSRVPPLGVSTSYAPKDGDQQKALFKWMKDDRTEQYRRADQDKKDNKQMQGGKLVAETLLKSMDSIFTHVANMRQMEVFDNYLNKQHDIARRSINLESKKLDVTKEMHNDQLRFQLKVAQHQKETTVTVAAIQEKGKTKRVQALAALRSVYGRGKPVSPFQRSMS